MLRPVKRVIKKYFLFDKSYIKRLATINSCDYLIYSGAGEASDNHVFLRQMLELRIAQKLGKKTGAVNQSVVVKDEAFKAFVVNCAPPVGVSFTPFYQYEYYWLNGIFRSSGTTSYVRYLELYDGFIYFQRQFRIRWKRVKSLENSSSYRNHRRDFTRQVPTRVCDRGILLRILPSAKYYIIFSMKSIETNYIGKTSTTIFHYA
jgi:hypothetical protein